MKPDSTRAATARVLADIEAAVRPVERARTAAAVDRVLTSAAPGPDGSLAPKTCLGGRGCPCSRWNKVPLSDRPRASISDSAFRARELYAPHNVSPHLFPTDPS